MIIIHRITPYVQKMDAFYVRFPDPSKVAERVNVKGINFVATPLRVHEDPNAELDWMGKWIWHLMGEDMYFTTDIQAHSVFCALYGRWPDRGTELRVIELTQSTRDVLEAKVEPVLYGHADHDQTDRDAVQADYQAEQRETDKYYGCPEHAMFGDRWFYDDPHGNL